MHTGQMHDADETTLTWIVSCIQFRVRDSLFNSLSARLLLINLFQSAKLTTLSAAIVTTLIFFLVAAIATRRRRWWRLYHPFRNIGQQIYHCNSFDYDSVLLRMTLMTSHDRHEAYILVENLNFNLGIYARYDHDVPIILLEKQRTIPLVNQMKGIK